MWLVFPSDGRWACADPKAPHFDVKAGVPVEVDDDTAASLIVRGKAEAAGAPEGSDEVDVTETEKQEEVKTTEADGNGDGEKTEGEGGEGSSSSKQAPWNK